MKYLTFLICPLFLFVSVSCSQLSNNGGSKVEPTDKGPRPASTGLAGESCSYLMDSLIERESSLELAQLSPEKLAERDLIIYEDWQNLRNSEHWQRVTSRSAQSDEDREMAFLILSILKKRHPKVDDLGLKDRFEVLMAFCGP